MKAGDYTQKEEILKELEKVRNMGTAKKGIKVLDPKHKEKKGGKTRRKVHRKRHTRK